MVQVCTNNATNKKFMVHHLQGAMHSLDLFLYNWRKEACVEKTMKKTKLVVNFIKNHHAMFAAYRVQSAQPPFVTALGYVVWVQFLDVGLNVRDESNACVGGDITCMGDICGQI